MAKNNRAPVFTSAILWVRHGRSDEAIASYLLKYRDVFEQPLYWLEPALRVEGIETADFAPFGECLPEKLPALDAAYLFGRYSGLPRGLHAVADGSGCRWFEFSAAPFKGMDGIAVRERSYPVLSRRDFKRFFGKEQIPAWCRQQTFKVIEYWHEAGLLAWWLAKEPS